MCSIRLSRNKALSVYSLALYFIFFAFLFLIDSDRGLLKTARFNTDCRCSAYKQTFHLFRFDAYKESIHKIKTDATCPNLTLKG